MNYDQIFKDVESAKRYYAKIKKAVYNWKIAEKQTEQYISDLKTVGKFLESKGVTRKELNKL